MFRAYLVTILKALVNTDSKIAWICWIEYIHDLVNTRVDKGQFNSKAEKPSSFSLLYLRMHA